MRAVGGGGEITRLNFSHGSDLYAEVGAIQLELDAGDAHVIGRGGRDRNRAHHGPGRWRGRSGRRRGGVWGRRGGGDKVGRHRRHGRRVVGQGKIVMEGRGGTASTSSEG